MDEGLREQKRSIPYGYRLTDQGLEPDPYQSKVVKLIFDLTAVGVTPKEIEYLIISVFKVPKMAETRPINFEELKREMIQFVQDMRQEEGMKPLELKL